MPAVIKPLKLSLTYRVDPFRGSHVMTVSAYGGFDLKDPANLLTEKDYMEAAVSQIPPGTAHDVGHAKPVGEVLVAGQAEAPGGNPVHGMNVSVSVGPVRRDLVVYGDRYWFDPHGDGMPVFSKPETFTAMPLTADRSFGGINHPENLVGRGFEAEAVMKQAGSAPLPNIEDALAQIRHIGDRPVPMLVGVLGHDHPQRKNRVGTYDWDWIKKTLPEWPDDFDMGYFNVAAPPQRLQSFFVGNEAIRVSGMSAANHEMISSLPGLRGRCFVFRDQESRFMTEVPMHLDTVWIFGSKEVGGIYFRGATRVADPLASDITHVMAGYEFLHAEPRSIDHYAEVFRLRTDPEEAALHMLNDTQLSPPLPEAVARDVEQRMEDEAIARKEKMEADFSWRIDKMKAATGFPSNLLPATPMPDVPLIKVPAAEDILAGRVDLAKVLQDARDVVAQMDRLSAPYEVELANRVEKAGLKSLRGVGAELQTAVEQQSPDTAQKFKDVTNLGDYLKKAGETYKLNLDTGRPPGTSPGPDDELSAGFDNMAESVDKVLDEMLAKYGGAPAGDDELFALARARALKLPEADPFFELTEAVAGLELPDLAIPDFPMPPDDGTVDPELINVSKMDPVKAGMAMSNRTASLDFDDVLKEARDVGLPDVTEGVDKFDEYLNTLIPGIGDGKSSPTKQLVEVMAKRPFPADAPTSMDEVRDMFAPLQDGVPKAPPGDLSERDKEFFENLEPDRVVIPEVVYPLEDYSRSVCRRLGSLVLEHLARGDSFAGRDLGAIDLSGANISERDWSGAFFEKGRFVNTDLSHSDASGCAFQGVNFSGAVAEGTSFERSNFSGALIAGANMRGDSFCRSGHLQGSMPKKRF